MTPRTRAALQERLLDAIKRAHPGTTDAAIASVAGCDRTLISRYRSGERRLDLDELVALVAEYGAPVVLGPLAARDGCEVRALLAAPAEDPVGSAAELTGHAADYLRALLAALRDGRLDDAERRALQEILRELVAEAHASDARLREVRA